jgi:hypothetical protein
MRVLSKYTRQILAQNAGRDLDRLTLKLALLRKDPFAFFRGCGHYGAASSETLQAYAATKRWPRSVDRLASVAARRIHRAWEIYCKDFDSGAVSAALAKIKPR